MMARRTHSVERTFGVLNDVRVVVDRCHARNGRCRIGCLVVFAPGANPALQVSPTSVTCTLFASIPALRSNAWRIFDFTSTDEIIGLR